MHAGPARLLKGDVLALHSQPGCGSVFNVGLQLHVA